MKMTADQILREIARCDREIAACQDQPAPTHAYLTVLGAEDWLWERKALEALLRTAPIR